MLIPVCRIYLLLQSLSKQINIGGVQLLDAFVSVCWTIDLIYQQPLLQENPRKAALFSYCMFTPRAIKAVKSPEVIHFLWARASQQQNLGD